MTEHTCADTAGVAAEDTAADTAADTAGDTAGVAAEDAAGDTATRAAPGRLARTLRIGTVVVVVAGLVVAAVLGRHELARAGRDVAHADPFLLAAAVAVALLSMVMYARMQAVLLRGAGVPVRFHPVVSLAFAAHSLSITVPGGPLFSTALNFRRMRDLGATASVASWVIAVGGALSTAGLAVVGVLGAVLAGGRGGLGELLPAAGLVAALAAATWVLRARPAVLRPVPRLVRRFAGERAGSAVDAAVRDLGRLRVGGRVWARSGVDSVGNWLLDAVSLALCCAAVGIHEVGPAGLLLAYTAGMAAAHATLVPSGLGVADAALAGGLTAAGAAAVPAVAATLIYRVIALGVVNAAGWWAWWRSRPGDADASAGNRERVAAPAPEGRNG